MELSIVYVFKFNDLEQQNATHKIKGKSETVYDAIYILQLRIARKQEVM